MHQGQSLRQIAIESKSGGHLPRHLGHFNRVSQPRPKVVRSPACEHLSFSGQPPKGPRLHYAIAVPLKWPALIAHWGWKSTLGKKCFFRAKHPTSLQIVCHGYQFIASRVVSQVYLPGAAFKCASFTRAPSSLCCTFATSAGSASGGSDVAYAATDFCHSTTAICSLPLLA